jgi:hypothetical protein
VGQPREKSWIFVSTGGNGITNEGLFGSRVDVGYWDPFVRSSTRTTGEGEEIRIPVGIGRAEIKPGGYDLSLGNEKHGCRKKRSVSRRFQ